MPEPSDTSPAISLPVGDRTITAIDHGTVVTIAMTGIPKNVHPGKLFRRGTLDDEPVRALNLTEEGAIALFRLLEQTEGVKRLLANRRDVEERLIRRRLKLLLQDPHETDWGT